MAGHAESRGSAVVHIGTHKTGTTSFQKWAHKWRAEIAARAGVDHYEGWFGRSHVELAVLCRRADQSMAARGRYPDWCLRQWQDDVRAHVRSQVGRPVRTLLFSAEALSQLRHPDEVGRLVELLMPRQVSVVVVLREPGDFLRAYAAELARKGIAPSPYTESYAYVEPDSWLVCYDQLLDAYGSVLGAENVTVLGYEEVVQRDGSVIPALARACGVDPTGLAWEGVWRNRTRRRADTDVE